MRIGSPRESTVEHGRRIEADVVFEAGGRSPLTLYFEATPPLATGLEPLPEAFVLATFAAAVWQGERRLEVQGALDRAFVEGLAQAMAVLHHWYPRCRPLALEPTEGLRTLWPAPTPHAAALCSGGVDALAMLRENLETFPRDHPNAFRTLVYLHGATTWDFVDGVPSRAHVRANEQAARRVEGLAERLGLASARVHTNAPVVYPDAESYFDAGHAATMLAPLVAAQGLVTDAHIASSGSGVHHVPHGSHPLLDPLFATGAVRVHQDQPFLSRHAKVGRIADWEPAFDLLSPCHQFPTLPEGEVNCGACEKCVRTMTSLAAWGALGRFGAFPHDDVTPEMIRGVVVRSRLDFFHEPDLLGHLDRVGRTDLADAIRVHHAYRSATGWAKRRLRWKRSLRKRWGRG